MESHAKLYFLTIQNPMGLFPCKLNAFITSRLSWHPIPYISGSKGYLLPHNRNMPYSTKRTKNLWFSCHENKIKISVFENVNHHMMSWQGNIFRITGHLWTGGFPSQRVSNVDLWCFLCCCLKQAVEHKADLLVIWDAMTLKHCHPNDFGFCKNVCWN